MPLNNPSALQAFGKYETRVMTEAAGDVAYTGYGFQPSAIIILAYHAANSGSVGIAIGTSEYCININYSTPSALASRVVSLTPAAGDSQYAALKTMDADGFTLTWTKAGVPSGTAYLKVIALP